jgi:hypothetical protein
MSYNDIQLHINNGINDDINVNIESLYIENWYTYDIKCTVLEVKSIDIIFLLLLFREVVVLVLFKYNEIIYK